MRVDERDFKKLLIDLDLSASEIGRRVRRRSWTVTLYFRGTLKNAEMRKAIKRVMRGAARRKGITLPEFWS